MKYKKYKNNISKLQEKMKIQKNGLVSLLKANNLCVMNQRSLPMTPNNLCDQHKNEE